MCCLIGAWIYVAAVCLMCDTVCPLVTCFCCCILVMGGTAASQRASAMADRNAMAAGVINKLNEKKKIFSDLRQG